MVSRRRRVGSSVATILSSPRNYAASAGVIALIGAMMIFPVLWWSNRNHDAFAGLMVPPPALPRASNGVISATTALWGSHWRYGASGSAVVLPSALWFCLGLRRPGLCGHYGSSAGQGLRPLRPSYFRDFRYVHPINMDGTAFTGQGSRREQELTFWFSGLHGFISLHLIGSRERKPWLMRKRSTKIMSYIVVQT